MTFYTGDLWIPEATITDEKTQNPVDPTAVVATVTAPSHTVTTPAVTKTNVGVYTCSVPLTEAGKWHVAFVGTGEHQGAKPETITVYSV